MVIDDGQDSQGEFLVAAPNGFTDFELSKHLMNAQTRYGQIDRLKSACRQVSQVEAQRLIIVDADSEVERVAKHEHRRVSGRARRQRSKAIGIRAVDDVVDGP